MGIFAEEIVTTDTLGRRTGPRMRHTIEEKLRIVEETRARGASVAAVARRHHVNRADAMAEAEELALDAPVPPPWVLPGQPPDQLTDFLRDGRTPSGIRVGPLILDQAPVPGQQRAGCHDPVQPQVPGQQPRQRGDHRAVSPVRLRAGDLAAQDRDLVPQDQDLNLLGSAVGASSASQPNTRTVSR